MADVLFPGFDIKPARKTWAQVVQIPDRIYSVDGKRFVRTNLDCMEVPSDDGGQATLRMNERLAAFSDMTRTTAEFVLLSALDGKRKSSTVRRWESELGLFSRTVLEALGDQKISTITLKMYRWYCTQKNPSQEKLLRSTLLYWIHEECPGLEEELKNYLLTTAPPKPRGMIEVQNAVAAERPLSTTQVHGLLHDIADLYQSGEFSPQTHLLWRLMISEALRPSQMELLRFEDISVKRDEAGRLQAIQVQVPIVKQAGTAARDYMKSHRLSRSLSQALVEHIDFVESVHGKPPPKSWSLFCVRLASDRQTWVTNKASVNTQNLITSTRGRIASLRDEFDCSDLFNRRFKHTKLTHLAAAGASLEVLAHAGFQTSTISLGRYVNLTEEAYVGYEEQLEPAHQQISDAFRGKVIQRAEATKPDLEHRIAGPDLDDDLGAGLSGILCVRHSMSTRSMNATQDEGRDRSGQGGAAAILSRSA